LEDIPLVPSLNGIQKISSPFSDNIIIEDMCRNDKSVSHKRIIYYECENQACGLRFPDLRDELVRERCPMCRERIKISLELDQRERENPLNYRGEAGPIIEVLVDNVRSGLNVGSIFRTADGVGVRKLYLCGFTPTPANSVVQKTALGAEKTVPWQRVNNGVLKARQLKLDGYRLWGLETGETAESLYSQLDKIGVQPLVLVVGNEVCGVDPEIIELCDQIVSIPMIGLKRSFNVATAFGIAASFLHYCQMRSQGSESKLPNTRLTP
jgi:23S rRNA (guanosine2251-2'-O)-methyltransferase